jgi:peptidoglycan/LPS O-acetylase OafA/YrhL
MSTPTAPQSGPDAGRQKRIISLDGLRGISALLVLFHHILLTQPDFGNYEWHSDTARPRGIFEWIMFETPLRLSWAGQDRAILFFVLSGFVLSLPWLHGHPRSYINFLLNRFWRLYPPYLIVMIVAAAGAILIGGHKISAASIWFNQLGWSSPVSWRAVPSIVFLTNGPSSNWLDESVWSLVWEARVVVIFPILIWAVVHWKNAGLITVLAALMAANPIIKMVIPPHYTDSLGDIRTAFLYPEFFILGIAVAMNQNSIRYWLSRWRGIAGIAVFALGLTLFWVHWPIQNSRADGIAATLILAAALGCPILARWLEAKFLLWLGQVSYSLYLIHVPIILTLVILYHGTVPLWVCTIMVPFCILAAELFRRNVETPSVTLALGLMNSKSTKKIEQISAA